MSERFLDYVREEEERNVQAELALACEYLLGYFEYCQELPEHRPSPKTVIEHFKPDSEQGLKLAKVALRSERSAAKLMEIAVQLYLESKEE